MSNNENEPEDLCCRKEKRKKFNNSCNFYMGEIDKVPSPNIDPNVDSRKGGDRKSDNYIRATKAKMNMLKQLIYRQLQHYSKAGVRLYSSGDLMSVTGWFSVNTLRKYILIICQDIFKDPNNAKLVYDMIFGKIRTSYHNIRRACFENRLILKTTSTQWFKMLKNREIDPVHLCVDVLCVENGHEFSVRVDEIRGCPACYYKSNEINYQNVLQLANTRGLQAVSFKDDTKPLTETEFNDLLDIYKTENQDPYNYKSKSNIYINLRWRHLDCGNVFEQAYFYILRAKVDQYCLKCYSSIDQQQTFLAFQEAFQDYSSLSFLYDIQLSRILPNAAILLRDKYESISYPNVHVDMFGIVNIDCQVFRVAIEHQGPQHYSFESYLRLSRPRDEASGIYKSDTEYRIDWEQSLKRDKAKVELFEELNKDGYYLIHVPYTISVSKRVEYILNEFTRQTGKIPGQSHILDWF